MVHEGCFERNMVLGGDREVVFGGARKVVPGCWWSERIWVVGSGRISVVEGDPHSSYGNTWHSRGSLWDCIYHLTKIVFTVFRLILNQTDCLLVQNQS